jgi:hypothetical protein
MDYGPILALIIVLAAAGGFLVLARTLFDNVKAASEAKQQWRSFRNKKCREFEECFNQCLRAEPRDRDASEICASRCRSDGDAHVCA